MFKGKPKFTKGENIMKKTKRISSFILVAVMCLSVFIGLTRNNTVTEINADSNSNVTVGVSLTSLDDAVMSTITTYIQSLYPNSNVTVTVENAGNNVNDQITQLTGFIVQQVDAIVIKPVNENALDTVLTNANHQGIVVIIIGQRQNNNYPFAIYVDFDIEGSIERAVNDFIENYWDSSENYNVFIFYCNNAHGAACLNKVRAELSNYSNITRHEFEINNVNEIEGYLRSKINNQGNQISPDAIFNCCNSNAEATETALINIGYTYDPNGMPVYGFRDFNQDVMNMIDFIADLLQGILDGEINPTNGMSFLIDISDGEN